GSYSPATLPDKVAFNCEHRPTSVSSHQLWADNPGFSANSWTGGPAKQTGHRPEMSLLPKCLRSSAGHNVGFHEGSEHGQCRAQQDAENAQVKFRGKRLTGQKEGSLMSALGKKGTEPSVPTLQGQKLRCLGQVSATATRDPNSSEAPRPGRPAPE
uniref:Uncharacterized protein n=1 Tax=Sus scrofa TaxID=9823 RepID=A0A8D1GVB3_PIG